ncbi:SDR family oxidoreductase [Sphingobium sp.]|uniref:SDR family oxidoreductase n=1 Tax=Sphingobium TaxID=165695 RepID=UPI001A1F8393|nr:SDR family oxidoreductase [Sphingobium sp.]MBJ7375286.1 SDR family oxidoreductase [Sphingobium sp.]
MTTLPTLLNGRHAMVAGVGDAADHVATALAALGARITRITPPSVDADIIAAAFADAQSQQGQPVDLLVHGGAPLGVGDAETVSLDVWRKGFSADIDGRFLYASAFARRRIAAHDRGAILFLLPSPRITGGRTAQLSAHGALDNLVKSLAVEWGRDGIRTNAIASHVVDGFAQATEAARASLGHLAGYILSDHGAYISGMVMGIDELPS